MTEEKKRITFMPAQATDFIVTMGGREWRWLSRILGFLLAPLIRWRFRQR